MKRFVVLVAAFFLVVLIGVVPAGAQDNGFDGPYVEPRVEEPTPPPERVVPVPPVEEEVVPVVERPEPVPPVLPITGLDLTVGGLLAAGLLLAGGGVLLVARRRTSVRR